MATSLAAQLQQRTTLDSNRLSTTATVKHPPSFIFTPRHAASVSTLELHGLASNAWEQLSSLNPVFYEKYYTKILGEQAKKTDRTALTTEENGKLDLLLDKVLRGLAPNLLLQPAGVVLEWLIRRFRVHQLNVTTLVAIFLPYHTTTHFSSLLSLITEQELATTPFAVFIPARKSLLPLALADLIALLPPFNKQSTADAFLDQLVQLPIPYLQHTNAEAADASPLHRPLVGFWLQSLAAYLDRARASLSQPLQNQVLSALLQVIPLARGHPDLLIAAYILLARFAVHNPIEGEHLRVVIKTVVANRAKKGSSQDHPQSSSSSSSSSQETDHALVTTLVVLCQLAGGDGAEHQQGKKFLGGTGWKALMKVQDLGDLLIQLSNEYDATKFMRPFLSTLAVEAITSPSASLLLSALLSPAPSSAQAQPLLLPAALIAHLTAATLTAILHSDPSTDPAPLLQALSKVQQRYPAIWDAEVALRLASAASRSPSAAAADDDAEVEEEEEDRETERQLLHSVINTVLSGGRVPTAPSSSLGQTLFLSSSSPSLPVRLEALKQLLAEAQHLVTHDPDGHGEFVRDTLGARLREENHEMQVVLLGPSGVPWLHRLLTGEEILEALLSVLNSHSHSHSHSHAHVKDHQDEAGRVQGVILPYLAGAFVAHFPELARRVTVEVFWTRLLVCKEKDDGHRQHKAWVALVGSQLEQVDPWLRGVGKVIEQQAEGEKKAAAGGAASNQRIVKLLAKNMAALPPAKTEKEEQQDDHQKKAIDFLRGHIAATSTSSSSSAPGVLLALLVAHQMAFHLPRSTRLGFIASLLASLRANSLDDFASVASSHAHVDTTTTSDTEEQALAAAVYSKPHHAKTIQRARAALLVGMVGAVQTVKEVQWSWLATSTSLQKEKAEEEEEETYRALVHSIYRLSHSHSLPSTTGAAHPLATKLQRTLFGQLVTADALAFLASVFCDPNQPEGLKIVALKDATTFVQIHSSSSSSATSTSTSKVDFQALVPSVLVALVEAQGQGQGRKKVRVAALDLLRSVKEGLPKQSATAEVYGRGRFYGSKESAALKYLDVLDLSKYLDVLLDSRTELVTDGSYLLTLHASLLDAASTAGPSASATSSTHKKSKATLKLKAYTFLLSHVLAWRSSVPARTTLLRTLQGINDPAKGALVVPILADVVSLTEAQRRHSTAGIDQAQVEEFGRLLLQPYEAAGRKWIEQSENQALETLNKALEVTDAQGLGAVIRKEALGILAMLSSLWAAIRGDARVDLFKRLVRLATLPDARLTADVLVCLRNIKVDSTTVTSFLNEIRLSLSSPVSKGAKRGRTSLGGSTPARPERLPELIVVLESLDFKAVSASHALLLSLFDLLSSIIEIPAAAQIDVQYPGQLMLSTLAKVVENVQPSSGVTGDSIRMTPVLDLMRSSNNPQTYHQALLLLAQLGPLVPDQLVHNVMPIFTFMGANVLQRDDAYSLRVVEKTLENIVPALVKSTKRSSGNRDALVSDLKELLSVFTDAAAHVPRHRRVSLFVRFVETLGAQDFLSAVAMLLVDKDVKAVDGTALPLALFESFPVDVQLSAFSQVIAEVSRLLEGESSFLDVAGSSDAGPSSTPQEQIIRLLHFLAVGLEAKQLGGKVDAARAAGSQTVDTALSGLVRGLLDIAPPPASGYSANDKEELGAAAGYGVQAAVHLMSTHSFSDAILWLLDLADPTIQARALALLRTRLPTIKASRRAEISPAVVTVVDRIRALLAESAIDSEGALETLNVVASSIFPEEDASLAKTVPELMAVARSSANPKSTRAAAIGILTKLTNRLGPRLIPLASKLIPFAVEMLKEEARDPFSASASVVIASFQVIEGLFMSIPTFIGAQVDKVFGAALSPEILSLSEEKHGAASKARALLLSTAAKKLPAKTLYPAIIRLHASLDGAAKEPVLGLLDLLNRALRHGKTADIAESYRPIFKLFLTIFDLRREHDPSLSLEDIGEIEENGLGAFVQFILKLNEQTFRPLFLRTYDWAVIDLADEENAAVSLTARRVVLYKLVDRLLTQLRSIVVPYFSFMLDQTVELLESFAKGDLDNTTLWLSVISALTKALEYDETGFWTPLRLSKLSASIAHQLEAPQQLTSALVTSHFHPLLSAYSQALLPHENHLKAFNTSLLMLTRSDDLRVKRGALEALDQLWESLGDGMLGLVPETTPFLAETMEEAEGGVEAATRTLVKRIEEHLGESLSSYLES